MARYTIYKLNLSGYQSIVWSEQTVFSRYTQLKNYLKQNLGDDYALLLAEPNVSAQNLKGVGEAIWSTDVLSAKAVALATLPVDKQNILRGMLQQKLAKVYQKIEELLNSADSEDNRWGQLMSKAFKITDEKHILVENEANNLQNDHVVLVAWGFVRENATEKDVLKDFFRNIAPIVEPIVKPEPLKPIIDEPIVKPEIPKVEIKEPEPIIVPPVIEPIVKPEIPKEEEKEPEKVIIPPVNNKGWRDKWWGKFWWLWLLLLLLALILGIRSCDTPIPVLPPEAGRVIPIDTTKIIKDKDSVKMIVSDRLNVALMGKNKDLKAFARKFKKLYPDKNYEIIYYDTITFRLQLQIPEKEREKMKSDLPLKIPEFEMLIWEEGIFQRNYTPSDPGFSNNNSWYHKRVKALEAWDITKGDSSVVVAIIDNGFDLSHPEFAGKIYKPWNVPAYSSKVNSGRMGYDGYGHGTHVAGSAVGWADNGQGVSGIAPNCKFMPIQVGDNNGVMSNTAVIDGVLYAINQGANVVNMSLGLQMSPQVAALPQAVQLEYINRMFKEEEKFWESLFKVAYEKNIIFVLAAGNQNILIGLDPMQRSKYTIKVSALDNNNSKASFSNFGAASTISAPGVQIYSSMPNGKFADMQGTSMASPVVAGGVALLKSVNPALSFDEIVSLLQTTGIPINSPNQYVGNLMQLDRAVDYANKDRQGDVKVECPDVQKKIDSLLQAIENLKRLCPPKESKDTLKLPPPEKEKSFDFAVGRWKSTTDLHSIRTGKPIVIYFDFYENGKGKITLIQSDNTECSADLVLNLKPNQLNINQLGAAMCMPPPEKYNPYTFVCKPDIAGCAECEAQNKLDKKNKFVFKLVRIGEL